MFSLVGHMPLWRSELDAFYGKEPNALLVLVFSCDPQVDRKRLREIDEEEIQLI